MRLRVVTYNVGNGLATPRRLVELLRKVEADLVALQELATDQAEVLAADLVDIYPQQVLFPAGFAGKGVLSRYPLLQSEQLALYPDRPDLRTTLDVEGQLIQVLVAHPPPPRMSRGRLRFDAPARAQLESLATLALERPPAILLGDFNLTWRDPMYAHLQAAGLQDAFAVAGSGRGWTLPLRLGHSTRVKHRLQRLPLRPFMRVDYIWTTPDLVATEAWLGEDAGSDHLPLVATLRLEPTAHD